MYDWAVRAIIWIGLFLLGVMGIVLPGVYLYTANGLPRLESEYDLETQLRMSIEGERMSIRAGQFQDHARSHKFEKPEFSKLPHDLIALYISQMGCSNFFRTPREEGPRWGWRLFAGMGNVELEGDGGCERYLALRLANALGIKGDLQMTVAANKLHGFLQKDQLIAYDMASMYFGRGIVGVEDAAWELYKKDLHKMELAELAEFTMALPIHGYYDALRECKNASIIKQNRDYILSTLAEHSLVPQEKVNEAMKQPVACLSVP